MTKKDFLLAILSKLKGKWNLAESISILIEDGILNDKTIDAIGDIIEKAYKATKLDISEAAMIQTQHMLQSMKSNEQQINKEEIDSLDNLISAI